MEPEVDKIVTADAHAMEPTDLWTSRLPERLRHLAHLAPVYRRLPESSKAFEINGRAIGITPEYRRYTANDEDFVDIAPDDIQGRLDDMDVDGVWAEVVHPNAGLFVYDLDDPDLAYICAAIYNDHVAEMYQSERIYPNAVIPILDADAAAAEIERAAGLGLHGIELPQTPPASCPYYDPFYEPVWTAAEKHRLPIAMHVATGPNPNKEMGVSAFDFVGRVRTIPEEGSMRDTALLARQLARGGFGGVGGECLETIPDLVAGGVLERHPDLHFVFVEVGARWLALLMDNMDDSLYLGPGVRLVQRLMYAADGTALPQYVPGEMELEWSLPLRPSDYVKRQVHVSFMDDYVALRNRDITTISPLLWGNDYPHYEGSWPKSRDAIRQQCERVDLTDDERRAIFGGTTAKLWSMA